MKRLIVILLLILAYDTVSATTLSETKILEASKNIKYLMQNIAKNYLYSYVYPVHINIHKKLNSSIAEMEKNIKIIALNSNKANIRNLLDFINYEKEEIKAMVKRKPNASAANEMIDVGETVTESAEKIASTIKNDFSFEEQMFLRTKNIEYLVEKFTMYYIIMSSNIDKSTISEKLDRVLKFTDKELDKVNQYAYPKIYKKQKRDIFRFWDAQKHYLSVVGSMKVPSVVILSASGIQNVLKKLAIHHAKGE